VGNVWCFTVRVSPEIQLCQHSSLVEGLYTDIFFTDKTCERPGSLATASNH
jgi:hypothetical protein